MTADCRRWLQFSLRTFFALLAVFSITLRVEIKAHEQREAVKVLEGLGGVVRYDWEPPFVFPPRRPEFVCGNCDLGNFDFNWNDVRVRGPGGPTRRQRFIGADLFQSVKGVWLDGRYFSHHKLRLEKELLKAIPTLQRINSLENLYIDAYVSRTTMKKLREALPGVIVLRPEFPNSLFGPQNP